MSQRVLDLASKIADNIATLVKQEQKLTDREMAFLLDTLLGIAATTGVTFKVDPGLIVLTLIKHIDRAMERDATHTEKPATPPPMPGGFSVN